MTVTFSNAPLVELITELRWSELPQTIQTPLSAGIAMPIMAINSTKVDEFFMRFGGKIYQHGFQQAERVVPSNFPFILFQPVFRYRKNSDDGSVLYQVGPGMFSANAVPPYRSWEEFSPIVKNGISVLLETRSDSEKALPFTLVSLRYIDAFGPDLTGGRDVGTFIQDILGIGIELPKNLSKHLAKGKSAKPFLQFVLPLANDLSMTLIIGDGMANNEQAIIMDMTVSTTGEIPPQLDELMNKLNAARSIVHEIFVDLTQPINKLMKPITE